MAFKFPWTNFHELNFDWMLKQWKEIYDKIPTKVSQLINDRHYINRYEAPVQSVNGATGHVVIPETPPEMFECQYGVTTWAAIDDARTEGKVPYVNYSGTVYMFTETIATDGHYFSAFPKDQKHKMIKCADDNTWSAFQDAVQEIYWCTYNSTLSADIETAYQAGKIPAVYNPSHSQIFYLNWRQNAAAHIFTSIFQSGGNWLAQRIICSANTWSLNPSVGLAPLASPTLTGTPKAPTATAGDNTTQIATTAFVQGELSTALANYIPLDGDANNLNPVDDLDDFTTGIAVFHNTAGTPIANFPWTSGPDFALVVCAGDTAVGQYQIAFDSGNNEPPRMRACAAGTWASWVNLIVDPWTKSSTFTASAALTVLAGSTDVVTIDCTEAGFTPIGIIGIEKTGTGSSYCIPYEYKIDNTDAKVYFRNFDTSDASIIVTVYVLMTHD